MIKFSLSIICGSIFSCGLFHITQTDRLVFVCEGDSSFRECVERHSFLRELGCFLRWCAQVDASLLLVLVHALGTLPNSSIFYEEGLRAHVGVSMSGVDGAAHDFSHASRTLCCLRPAHFRWCDGCLVVTETIDEVLRELCSLLLGVETAI